MRSPSLRARRGFTLAETLLSMTLMLILIGLSTQLFRKQSGAVASQNGVLDAQSTSRYALSMLDRELRVAGVGVIGEQPLLVQAGPLAITFNADLAANDTGDVGAVYINPDADSAGVDVMKKAERLALPGTTNLYPDTTYTHGNTPSNAETISYWLSRDSTSTRTNEYILFRRLNARPAKVVARGIIYNTGDTIFQYFKADTAGTLTAVGPVALPLIHTAMIHGTTADTGKSAVTDSIRQVKVQFTSVYHDPRTNTDKLRRSQTTIHLMNAGLIHHSTCGNTPIAVTNAVATVTPANGTTVLQPYVTISWSPSVDDGGGESDVQRYGLYRRLSTVATFDTPFTSIPSNPSAPSPYTYTYRDTDVLTGESWIYGVAAQDCTPAISTISTTSTVVIP